MSSLRISTQIFVLLLFFCNFGYAKPQKAVIAVDGAAVYKAPSFDAPVLDYLDKGKKVLISGKTYPGAGGLGVFFKVKIGKKQYGYLVDTEVKPSGGGIFSTSGSQTKPVDNPVDRVPIYFTRYLGGGVNYINYTDKYENTTVSSFTPAVSVKASGPGWFFGAPIDLEISTSVQVAEYFRKFSYQTDGFFLHGSLQLMAPLAEYSKALLYYAYGLTMVYESFKVEPREGMAIVDSQELRLGAKFTVGTAFQVGKFVLKAEGNYYLEKANYISGGLYLQMPY